MVLMVASRQGVSGGQTEEEASMKQAKWLALVAVGIAMVLPGCKSLGDRVNVANIAEDKLVVPIMVGESDQVGNINMWNDGDYIYISYMMRTASPGTEQWYLKECHADIELHARSFPVQKGSGEPDTSRFAYKSGDIGHCQAHTFTIPISDWTGTVSVLTRSAVCQLSADIPPVEVNNAVLWAGTIPLNRKTTATYFEYTFGDVSGGWYWMNAWAGTGVGTLDFQGNDGATYIWHYIGTTTNAGLYAGQTQCGTVTVTDNVSRGKGRIYVTYSTGSGWEMKSCHVEYATAANGVPQVNGNPTTAEFRGQSGTLSPYVNQYTLAVMFKAPETIDHVVIAAHADAGVYE